MTGSHLMKIARKFRGKAASVDSWGGTEIAYLPQCVFDAAADAFALFEREGKVPYRWTLAKQCHIPKTEAADDGSLPVGKLRPITILSTWFRLYGSARLRSSSATAWADQWWPRRAKGGKRGTGVHEAFVDLAEATAQDGYLMSLDYTLAFDHLDPCLVHLLFCHTGMPPNVALVFKAIWTSQQRLLVYDGQSLPHFCDVSTSLPQGDPWSLIGMVLALTPPTHSTQAKHPSATIRTFVDDRTCVVPSVMDILQIKADWDAWLQKLGLRENLDKICYYHQTPEGRRQLVAGGLAANKVSDDPKILGIHLRGTNTRTITESESMRLKQAITYARRCAHLPVSCLRYLARLRGDGCFGFPLLMTCFVSIVPLSMRCMKVIMQVCRSGLCFGATLLTHISE